MAASAVQLVGHNETLPRMTDVEITEPCPGSLDLNALNASMSMFSNSSGGSETTRRDTPSPVCKFNYSDIDSGQNFLESRGIAQEIGDHNQFDSTQKLCMRKSRVGSNVLEQNPVHSTLMSSHLDQDSHTSIDINFDSAIEAVSRASIAMPELSSQNDWNFSVECPSNTQQKPSANSIFSDAGTKQNYSQFPTTDLASAESKSQSFDYEFMKKSYNSETTQQTMIFDEQSGDQSKSFKPPLVPSWKPVNFETSELAMRLRSSVQSDFLSNELRAGTTTRKESPLSDNSNALRSIDEILKQYGISNNIPVNTSSAPDDSIKRLTSTKQSGMMNLSQNNETLLKDKPAQDGTRGSNFSVRDTSAVNTNMYLNQSFRAEPATSSFSYRDSTHFLTNISQNNETSKSQGGLESDSLRRYGSSVDYTASATATKYPGSGSFKMGVYDYGKSVPLTGDTSVAGMNTYPVVDSKQYETNFDKIKLEGSQVDLAKPPVTEGPGSRFDALRGMNSSSDALEYSMFNERQRLRKLDTMISSTPFYSTPMELPKSMRDQYKSNDMYGSFRSSDLGKIYSSPTIPSSSGYGARVSHKSSWAGNVGQRSSTIALGKSTSAPGHGVHGLQAGGRYSTYAGSRTTYVPYKPKFNMQQNNSVNNVADDNANKSLKKNACRKGECPLQQKAKKDGPGLASHGGYENQSQSMYSTSSSRIPYQSNNRLDKGSVAEKKCYTAKLVPKRQASTRKSNLDFSKNASSVYDGFDFAKDLNRMWQECVFGSAHTSNSSTPQQPRKYTPYKPSTNSQAKKQCGPAGSTETFSNSNVYQISARPSQSAWSVARPASVAGYESDSGLKLAHKVQSHNLIGAQNLITEKNKRTGGALTKPKSCFSLNQMTPKSILKPTINKATHASSASVNRPYSAATSSLKSYASSTQQMPFYLVRGFSPLEKHKTAKAHPPASARKEHSTKHKSSSKTSTGNKQGRRLC